jgi:4-amino-4-deoxy-L-arabinose transferase-like glycosyltransferase
MNKATGRTERVFWLGLLLMALLCTAVVVLNGGGRVRYADEIDYLGHAQRLVQGLGYVLPDGQPSAYRPPGYAFVLAAGLGLGGGVLALQLFNVLCLVASVLVMRQLLGQAHPVARAALPWLVVAYPVLMYTASTLYPQTFCLLLLVSILCLVLRAQGRWWPLAAAGLLFGALLLTAPSFVLLTPLLVSWLAWQAWVTRQGWHRGLLQAALAGLCAASVLAPWLWRNQQVFGEPVFIATNGGINLLLGNNAKAGPNTGVNVDIYGEVEKLASLNEVARSRAFQQMALDWMRANPQQAASLYARKVLNYFNFRADTANRQESSLAKDLLMALTYYPLLAVAVWRLSLWRRRPLSQAEGLLWLFYLSNAFLAAVFFTRIRFRLPFDGLLIMLAALALPLLAERWRAFSGRSAPKP